MAELVVRLGLLVFSLVVALAVVTAALSTGQLLTNLLRALSLPH